MLQNEQGGKGVIVPQKGRDGGLAGQKVICSEEEGRSADRLTVFRL